MGVRSTSRGSMPMGRGRRVVSISVGRRRVGIITVNEFLGGGGSQVEAGAGELCGL